MASRAPPWPAAARSTERSMLISLTAARSRCRTPRRFSNEVLRAPGASASSLLASGSPQLAKAEGGDPSTPAEASSDRSVIRATSSRNSERNHPGTPSEIKSDWRATPFRIRERLRPESAPKPLSIVSFNAFPSADVRTLPFFVEQLCFQLLQRGIALGIKG